jgi:beta-glucanase (GH16 family)
MWCGFSARIGALKGAAQILEFTRSGMLTGAESNKRRSNMTPRLYFVRVCLTLLFSSCAYSQTGSSIRDQYASDGYKLVWADEFDRDGSPDPANWTYEHGFVRNRELQWYQPENARCEKGLLIIEARREKKANLDQGSVGSTRKAGHESAEYTSASITTKGLHSWQYGRFVMRGRIDTRPGLWPAFWTIGTGGRWPASGEIDIMEYYRGMLLANVAWASAKPLQAEWDDSRKPISEFNDPDWSNQFHVWRMDWDSDSIRLFVDEQLLNEVDLTKTFNKDAAGKNPLRQPHYIILNLAIGGTSGGDPSQTEFPARFEVDYVRVYRK